MKLAHGHGLDVDSIDSRQRRSAADLFEEDSERLSGPFDLDLDGRTVTVRAGKAGKFGRVPLHAEAVSLLRRYLAARGLPDVLNSRVREKYWIAGASNALAGAPAWLLILASKKPTY